jgi:hypothetical protein
MDGDRTIDIGGPEILSYGDMLRGYATVRGLKRWIIPVPVLTPRLSSHWVQWVTPLPATIARPLIEGLRNEAVVQDDSAARIFPSIQPITYNSAVREALAYLDTGDDLLADDATSFVESPSPLTVQSREGMIIERYQKRVQASASNVFRAIRSASKPLLPMSSVCSQVWVVIADGCMPIGHGDCEVRSTGLLEGLDTAAGAAILIAWRWAIRLISGAWSS